MLRIVLGYKTPGLHEDPKVLYCGCDGNEAEKAVQKNPDMRIEMSLAPTLIRRRGYTAPIEAKKGK